MDNIKLTKPMMHGPAVKRLQEIGDLLGVDTGENDGIFGKQTLAMVLEIQKRFGLKEDGIVGPATWKAMRMAADGGRQAFKSFDLVSEPNIYDRRGRHPHPKLYQGQRDIKTITSIVIHQTGCKMPSFAEGWDRLNGHIGITKLGDVVIVNDFSDLISHAQGLSRKSICVEIAGNFAGIKGNPKTVWKGGGGPHLLTMEQLSGARKALEYIQEWANLSDIKIRRVFGHRQSKDTRTADPGQEIWEEIALQWQSKVDATDGGDDFHRGSGKPIPREWDKRRSSRYWA